MVKHSIVTFLCLILPVCFFCCSGIDTRSPSVNRIRLVWNDDPSTTMTIIWNQRHGSHSAVYYGETDCGTDWQKYPSHQVPTRIVHDYLDMDTHFVELKGLLPNRYYYFVIKDNHQVSRRYWFLTAPSQPQPFTFLVGGDTKSSGRELSAGRLTNKIVAKLRPLFVVFTGDYVTGNGKNARRWKLWLTDWQYQTTTTDGRMFPLVPVRGDHEHGDRTVLNKLFNTPNMAKSGRDDYYSLNIGNSFFHLVVLNSEQVDISQAEWLRQDLDRHRENTFITAAYHNTICPHTIKESFHKKQYEDWATLFYIYGVDIAFEGDSHLCKITYPIKPGFGEESYQGFMRDDRSGTMYVGDGCWGAKPRAPDDLKPWTLLSGAFHHVHWIHVYPKEHGQSPYMEIRTVITATREQGRLISHIKRVENLTEDNVFRIPEHLDLYAPEQHGAVIHYPYRETVVK